MLLLHGCLQRYSNNCPFDRRVIGISPSADVASNPESLRPPFDEIVEASGLGACRSRIQRLPTNRHLYHEMGLSVSVEVERKWLPDHVEIIAEGRLIARHVRHYGRGEQILNPLHYLAILGCKTRLPGSHGSISPMAITGSLFRFCPCGVVEDTAAEETRGVEIVLAHGRTVRVRSGFDRQTLTPKGLWGHVQGNRGDTPVYSLLSQRRYLRGQETPTAASSGRFASHYGAKTFF